MAPQVAEYVLRPRGTEAASASGTLNDPMDHQTTFGELIPCGGGDSVPLLKAKLVVGRRSSCDIALGYPNVSSQHCQLELINGYWHIRDLKSRNGIKVNGVRCDNKWLLPGDEVSIAKHRYEVVYHPDATKAPPTEEDPFSKSLMEKAGLARSEKPDRRSPALPPPARAQKETTSRNGSDSDADVLGWLGDDNEG